MKAWIIRNKTLLVILLVLVGVVLIAKISIFWAERRLKGAEENYVGVQLTNGQFYIAKRDRFSRSRFTDVWTIERVEPTQPGAPEFGLRKFTDAVWDPQDELYLNQREVLWMASLNTEGDFFKGFRARREAQ